MENNAISAEPAILARGVTKQYGKDNKVLDHLNMTVVKGTIYGLLGASGSGKTTLLNAILGSRKIQNGCISILGKPPGVVPITSIGYMPQDIALIGELTIKNVLQHQGWIFGMTNKEIDERHKFFETLLDLPPGNRLIKNLSGGQQRRVSLAVVLIQDPELLILDEPTVGLDPILRQTLWDYFIKITKEEKKTVVITTHYIEEARQADMVGMLRNGKMLIEGEPQTLMNQFNYNSLEDLFALLSAKQEGRDLDIPVPQNTLISESDESKVLSQKTPKQTLLDKICFMNRGHMKALLSKNFYRYVRHAGTLIIALIFPILQISAVFIAIRIPNDLKIGVVNHELGEYKNCEDYVKNHTIGGRLVDEIGTCEYTGLGCKFVEQIQDVIPYQIYFESIEEAIAAVKKGHVHQVLHFPHNYSEAFEVLNNVGAVEPEDFDFSQINFYRDEVDNPFRLYVEMQMYNTYLKFTEELAGDCQWNKHAIQSSFAFKDPIYGKSELTYADFIAPGMMSIVVLGLANALAILTIVSERNGGVWERTIISGVKPAEILIGHLLTLSFTSAIQAVEVFLIPHYIFGLECKGKVLHAILLVYSQGLVGVTLGILMSVVSKNEVEAIFGALGIQLPFFMLSGFFWPLEGMSTYLKYFSYALPPTIPTESLNNIVFRGWDITNFHVFKGFLMSIGYIFVITTISVLGLRIEKK